MHRKKCLKAFSLVELLVVIAIIAIIAAIAIPGISNLTTSARDAKDRRNAQTLASTYSAAVTSGLSMSAAGNVEEAVDILLAGTNIPVGNTVHYFSVDGISPQDRTGAESHLDFSNGMLVLLPP